MTKTTTYDERESAIQTVDHYVDYLWLMRSFEEELAKEARKLLEEIKIQKRREQNVLEMSHIE